MRVLGYTIPQKQIDAGLAVMDTDKPFEFRDVANAIGWIKRDRFYPNNCDRIADRLLQKERRAGNIYYFKGRWHSRYLEEDVIHLVCRSCGVTDACYYGQMCRSESPWPELDCCNMCIGK